MDTQAVEQAIVACCDAIVMPRFRTLKQNEIEEKGPGDLVTIADRECEVALTKALRDIVDVTVVGEEATAENAELLSLTGSDACWIVDPIDGTSNFAAGRESFAVMVAFAEHGVTSHAWIWYPVRSIMLRASRGGGAWMNGESHRVPPTPSDLASLSGVFASKHIPSPLSETATVGARQFESTHRGSACAGIDYLDLVEGRNHFLSYWRTMPWDHAPGTLIATEAGCRALRPDGSEYEPGVDVDGLFVAPTAVVDAGRQALFEG